MIIWNNRDIQIQYDKGWLIIYKHLRETRYYTDFDIIRLAVLTEVKYGHT